MNWLNQKLLVIRLQRLLKKAGDAKERKMLGEKNKTSSAKEYIRSQIESV